MLDWAFMVQQIPHYGKAIGLTLQIAAIGIVLSMAIGLCCSLIAHYKIWGLKPLIQGYVELSRNTPLLIQLFFLYYGLPKVGIVLSEFQCAVMGLTFLGSSYMAEAFRSGIEAVGKNQIESALSIGLSKFQIARYVVLPQAVSTAVPLIGANAIFLIKETSVVCVIAVAELMYLTKDLIGMYYQTYEALTLLVLSYLLILVPLSWLLTKWERRLRYAEHGR